MYTDEELGKLARDMISDGQHDADTIASHLTIAVQEEDSRPKVYIVWDMNADFWTSNRQMKSIHATLDGAINAVPDDIRRDPHFARHNKNNYYIRNYTYFTIEERVLPL